MALATRIIPVLLHKGPSLYKGTGFDAWRQVGHAMQASRIYGARAVDEMIILDIEATPKESPPNFDLIQELTGEFFTPITVGGGIKTFEDFKGVFDAGADKAAICTGILENSDLLLQVSENYGSQAVVAVVEYHQGRVTSHCGRRQWPMDPVQWAMECQSQGAGEILLSCVERDGRMIGYDLPMLKSVCRAVDIPVIAMGGAGTYQHMLEAVHAGASAVAAGAAFQFQDLTPKGAAEYLKKHGVEVRL